MYPAMIECRMSLFGDIQSVFIPLLRHLSLYQPRMASYRSSKKKKTCTVFLRTSPFCTVRADLDT